VTVEDRWLSVDELTEYLGVSRDTVYTWLSTKALPGHKVGRLWKFKREEIDDWVRAGHANSAVGLRNEGNDDPQPVQGKAQPRTRRRR
jgi:excisionase family DNA binding protein